MMAKKVASKNRVIVLAGLAVFLSLSGFSTGALGRTTPAPVGRLGPKDDLTLLSVARKDLRSQHLKMAEEAISELLSSHPHSIYRGPALLLLARIHGRKALQKGARNFREPLVYFRRAEAVLPPGWDKGEVLFREGRYLIRQRFGAEGRGILSRLLTLYPESPWGFRARLAIADSWRERGNLRRAEAMLEEARARLGSYATKEDRLRYAYLRGHLLLDRGNLPGAESAFLAALSLSKRYPYHHPGSLLLLARTAYALHHNHRAAVLFRSFERLFPDDPRSGEAEYYLARLSGRFGLPSHERARLRAVVADNPGSTASHMARIELLRQILLRESPAQKGRDLPELLSRAIRELGRIAPEERNQRVANEATLLRIRLEAQAGDWEEAIRESARLEGRIDPASRLGQRVRKQEETLVLGRIAHFSKPLRARKVLALYRAYRYRLPPPTDPQGAALYLVLARAERKVGHRKRAEKALANLLDVVRDPAIREEARRVRYRWLVKDGQKVRAYQWAVMLAIDSTIPSPGRERWFSNAEELARTMKNPGLEQRVLSRWSESGLPMDNPGKGLARLGLLDIRAGHAGRGLALLKRALPEIEDNPKDQPLLAEVLFHLGQESFLRGKRAEARRYWQKMLACCPNGPHGGWVTYQLGQISLSEGHPREALDWFEKTVRQYSGDEVARIAEQKISALKLEKKDGKP